MKREKNTTKQKEISEMSLDELKETENKLYAEYNSAEKELRDSLKKNPLALEVEMLRKEWNAFYTVVQNAEKISKLEKELDELKENKNNKEE